jgi:hypothetical protein
MAAASASAAVLAELASAATVGSTAPATLSLVAWLPSRELDLPEWINTGRRLGAIGRGSQWGVGDWIRYGNAKFGERYARAARITGYDVQTLMNMVYVASRFEISRRRENLSWSHHETLAALEVPEQEHWLDRAAAEKLSISDLRVELRSSRRDSKRTAAAQQEELLPALAQVPVSVAASVAPASVEPGSGAAEGLVCPHCGGRIPGRSAA